MGKLKKYLEDQSFIRWVAANDPEPDSWWRNYMLQHPEEEGDILRCRSILRRIRTKDAELTRQERELLYKSVLRQIERNKRGAGIRSTLLNLGRYAAVAVLFFAAGSLLFYRKASVNPIFLSQNLTDVSADSTARLIRFDGSDIPLEEGESKVEVIAGGKVVVNQDTLLNHTEEKSVNDSESICSQLIIPYGKTSQMLLSDGTRVYLNAGSRFVFPEEFTGSAREVMLVGEAFFEVAHDPDHPFIVQTSDLRIHVLGTKFNVSAYLSDSNIETVLTEGSVHIERNNRTVFEKAVELVPMQLASFNRATGVSSISDVDPENYILWKDGVLKFESMELNRVVKKLERYYNIRFRFSDPMTGTVRINGKLELTGDLPEALVRVAKTARVKINKINEQLYEIKE